MKKLNLFGPVYPYEDCINAKAVSVFLTELQDDEEFTVYLNSPGGSVFEGLAIFNLLKEYSNRMTIKIIGEASSIASVIACAAEKGKNLIAETALMLIHNPWTSAWAVDEDYLKKLNKTLGTIKSSIMKIYVAKTTLNEEKLNQIMSEADYHTAEECVEIGIADEVYIPSADEAPIVNSSEIVKNELLRKYEFFNLIRNKETNMTIEEAKAEIQKISNEKIELKSALNSVQESLNKKDSELKNASEQINVLNNQKVEAEKKLVEMNNKLFIEEAKNFCEEMFKAGKMTRAEIDGNANVANNEIPAKVAKLVALKNASEELYKMEIEEIKARSDMFKNLKDEIGTPHSEGDYLNQFINEDYNKRS